MERAQEADRDAEREGEAEREQDQLERHRPLRRDDLLHGAVAVRERRPALVVHAGERTVAERVAADRPDEEEGEVTAMKTTGIAQTTRASA